MTSMHHYFWAAQRRTRLLVKLMPKGVVLSSLSFHDTNAGACGVTLHLLSFHDTNAGACGVTLHFLFLS